MSEIKLDAKDRKILHELDFGARQPISRIAKKVRLSQEVVAYRIKRLEEKGVITGYYAIVDIPKLGYYYCRLFLKFQNMTPEVQEELTNYTKQLEAVGWIVIIQERWDLVVGILGKDLYHVKKICDDICLEFANYIQEKTFTVGMKVHHFKHNYLYGTKDTETITIGEEPRNIKIDNIDRTIISELSQNARATSFALAKKVDLTANAIRTRIQNLEKTNVILGYRANVDMALLGYQHQKVMLYTQKMDKNMKIRLIEFLRNAPIAIYVTEPLGSADIEFEVQVKNNFELYDFLQKMKETFPDVIKNYETLMTIKMVAVPEFRM